MFLCAILEVDVVDTICNLIRARIHALHGLQCTSQNENGHKHDHSHENGHNQRKGMIIVKKTITGKSQRTQTLSVAEREALPGIAPSSPSRSRLGDFPHRDERFSQ